jgi:hypothetical protein
MGMNTRGGGASNKIYLGIYQNQMVLEYNKEEDLLKKVESLGLDPDKIQVRQRTKGKNEGKDVFYYVIYDVEGVLSNATINETDWGDFLELEITDVDEKFVVSLGDVFGRMAKDFIRRAGNLDLSSDVNFGVWSMSKEETGSSARAGVKMYQDDEKVEYFISYDDMPEPVEKKKGRKTEWDYTDQETYLYEKLVAWIEENFKGEVKESAPEPQEEKPQKRTRKSRVKANEELQPEGKADDLPF